MNQTASQSKTAKTNRTDLHIVLSRQERFSICDAINRELQRMAADYAASCDRKAPNLVLFREHGLLMRLRDKVMTGKSYAEQDAEDGDAAEASERAGMRLMGAEGQP